MAVQSCGSIEAPKQLKSCIRDPDRPVSPSKEFDLKRIFFDQITIREHVQILGDNPAVSDGAPVTLSWEVQDQYDLPIDMYEFTRIPMRCSRRKEMMISAKKRVRTLIEAGYSPEEIGEAILSVEKAKCDRIKTVQNIGWNGPLDVFSGAVETTGAAFRGLKRRSSKIIMGSVSALGVKMKLPKRKVVTSTSPVPPNERKSLMNPAC